MLYVAFSKWPKLWLLNKYKTENIMRLKNYVQNQAILRGSNKNALIESSVSIP